MLCLILSDIIQALFISWPWEKKYDFIDLKKKLAVCIKHSKKFIDFVQVGHLNVFTTTQKYQGRKKDKNIFNAEGFYHWMVFLHFECTVS